MLFLFLFSLDYWSIIKLWRTHCRIGDESNMLTFLELGIFKYSSYFYFAFWDIIHIVLSLNRKIFPSKFKPILLDNSFMSKLFRENYFWCSSQLTLKLGVFYNLIEIKNRESIKFVCKNCIYWFYTCKTFWDFI